MLLNKKGLGGDFYNRHKLFKNQPHDEAHDSKSRRSAF